MPKQQQRTIEAEIESDKKVSHMRRELTEVKEMAIKLRGYATRNAELERENDSQKSTVKELQHQIAIMEEQIADLKSAKCMKCPTKDDHLKEITSKLKQEGIFRDQMKEKIRNLESIIDREKHTDAAKAKVMREEIRTKEAEIKVMEE